MQQTKINLACGNIYVTGNGWINIDYNSTSSNVRRADLLARLPLPDNSAALVYSSHFLEHIPRSQVPDFLSECLRVLIPGGVIRLVLPDLENICRAYLEHRDNGDHEKADFVVLEMIDQCVRRESGGELGRYYQRVKDSADSEAEMIAFIRERTGEYLLAPRQKGSLFVTKLRKSSLLRKVQSRLQRVYFRTILKLLPITFRKQNVSLAAVGELHHWIWDFYQLQKLLLATGFVSPQKCSSKTSYFLGFPFDQLDIDADGRQRKGYESMYIEAKKPHL